MEAYIPQLIATGIAITLLFLFRFIANKLILKYGNTLQKSEIRRTHMKRVIFILINITFILIVAIIWGVQPRNLLLGLSSIFAVIGVALFAQWSILSNITAGIIMFFTPPFRIGTSIQIMDKDMPIEATIENINSFYTHIRTNKNELIILPNNIFLQKIVLIKKEEGK